jgi:hypothetical protein
MKTTSAGPVLCALTAWVLLANASAYAAAIRASGGGSAVANDTVERSQSALAVGSPRHEEVGQDDPIRSGDTASHGSKNVNSLARAAPHPAALHTAGLVPRRSVDSVSGERTGLSKALDAAAHGYLLRGPAADHRHGSTGPEAPRAVGATNLSAAAASRQTSTLLSAASRPPAILRPMAVTGVIGGPRAAGPGGVGGPANSRTVINASINGAALRHRS